MTCAARFVVKLSAMPNEIFTAELMVKVGIVIGSVVATTKEHSLVGKKLLIVQKVDQLGGTLDYTEIAVDSVGAGTGEYVLVTTGGSARNVFETTTSTIDAAIVAIVDSMEVNEWRK